jgi:hypothetical protein
VTWGAPLEGGVFRRGSNIYDIHLSLGSTYAEVITWMFYAVSSPSCVYNIV